VKSTRPLVERNPAERIIEALKAGDGVISMLERHVTKGQTKKVIKCPPKSILKAKVILSLVNFPFVNGRYPYEKTTQKHRH